jgi:hypothetical protein
MSSGKDKLHNESAAQHRKTRIVKALCPLPPRDDRRGNSNGLGIKIQNRWQLKETVKILFNSRRMIT